MTQIEMLATTHKTLFEAIEKINTKFKSNETARKVVRRTIETENLAGLTLVRVNIETIFPSFIVPAFYVFFGGLIVGLILGNGGVVFSGMMLSLFLLLPDVFKKPRITYMLFRLGLRKSGYRMGLRYLGGKQ